MLRAVLGVLLALLLAGRSAAEVHCPEFFELQAENGRAIVLTLVSALPQPEERAQRVRWRKQLERRLTPKLQTFADKLAERVLSASPRMLMVTCDAEVGPTDLAAAEIEAMSRRNVIAVLWPDEHGGTGTVVHLSLLQALRQRDWPRARHEVEWPRHPASAATLEGWATEFERDTATQQALLAVGLGLHSLQTRQWGLAMYSLCQARAGLADAARGMLRPDPGAFQQQLRLLAEDGLAQARQALATQPLAPAAAAVVQLACQLR